MKISCSCFPAFSITKSTNPQIHGPATSARQRHLVSNGPPDGCEALTNPQVNVCLRRFLDSEVVIFPFTLDSYPSRSILYIYMEYYGVSAKIVRARSKHRVWTGWCVTHPRYMLKAKFRSPSAAPLSSETKATAKQRGKSSCPRPCKLQIHTTS